MRRIAVVSRDGGAAGDRLFSALSDALRVTFVDRSPGEWRDVDAVVVRSGETELGESATAAGLPSLVSLAQPSGNEGEVTFADDGRLDPKLRNARIVDGRGAGAAVPVSDGDVVLASCNGIPRWTIRAVPWAHLEHVALPIGPLGEDDALRDALKAPDFLSLLPLVHFIRRLTADYGWVAPPLRASFMFDDPNLHWPSYGYVKYRELAVEAERLGFHAAMAMVPLDGWFAHPGAARAFRDAPKSLSLVVHGNDHTRRELKSPGSEADALRVVGQALKRVAAFERRSGVPVSRVMVPPHGGSSELSARALSRLGFEAMCATRIRMPNQTGWGDRPLLSWGPGDFASGGLPMFTRHAMRAKHGDLVLRAYLDQPLLIYGHHEDLSEGLGILRNTAAMVGTFGAVRWGSLTDIVRSNFATRREGSALGVRLFCRRATVRIPEGVDSLRVEIPSSAVHVAWKGLRCGGRTIPFEPGTPHAAEPFAVTSGETVEIFADVDGTLQHDTVTPAPRSVWPIARRCLTESRDRLGPFVPAMSRRLPYRSGSHLLRRLPSSDPAGPARGEP